MQKELTHCLDCEEQFGMRGWHGMVDFQTFEIKRQDIKKSFSSNF